MPKKKKGAKGVVRLPSSDLPSQQKGWVEVQMYLKAKDLPYIRAFKPSGLIDPNATIQEQEEALAGTYRLLGRLVYGWNWEDPDGDPYPEPKGNLDVFGELKPLEFDWLIRTISKVIEGQAVLPKQKESASKTS